MVLDARMPPSVPSLPGSGPLGVDATDQTFAVTVAPSLAQLPRMSHPTRGALGAPRDDLARRDGRSAREPGRGVRTPGALLLRRRGFEPVDRLEDQLAGPPAFQNMHCRAPADLHHTRRRATDTIRPATGTPGDVCDRSLLILPESASGLAGNQSSCFTTPKRSPIATRAGGA